MNVSKGAYIVANGMKYSLVRVEGITYKPEYTYSTYRGETKPSLVDTGLGIFVISHI